jgi:hypothetical protein
MATTTVPVTYDADAKARLDELGLHDVCEKMIEHILETLPNLQRLEVTGPYVEHLGPDQQVVFEAYMSGPPTIEDNRAFDKWVIANIPGAAGFWFVLSPNFGQPHGR